MPILTEANRKWWTLGAMCFALFMVMLDNTVVNIALPAIKSDFGASISGLSWAVNAYTLSFAVLLVTGGRLGDVFGRKRMFLAGLVAFTLASIGAGLSQSIGQLIFWRAAQGAGAAFLMPGSLSILTDAFHGRERGRALGLWAGISGLALGMGPGARRPARREGRLGVDLLPERPRRADRRARDPLRRARVARPVRGAPDRLGGHRHAVARDGPRRARPRSGQRRGLDIDPHAGRAGGRRGRPRGLRLAPDRRRRPHGRPRLLQEPHVLGREPGRVPRDLLDVRDVLLHHALHAGHPAPLAARDRRAVPADDGADHPDGPHRRAPVRPVRQPLAPRRGHAARVALAGARVAHHRHERLPHPPPRVHRGRDRDGDDDVADDRGRDGLGRPHQGRRRVGRALDDADDRRRLRRRDADRALPAPRGRPDRRRPLGRRRLHLLALAQPAALGGDRDGRRNRGGGLHPYPPRAWSTRSPTRCRLRQSPCSRRSSRPSARSAPRPPSRSTDPRCGGASRSRPTRPT